MLTLIVLDLQVPIIYNNFILSEQRNTLLDDEEQNKSFIDNIVSRIVLGKDGFYAQRKRLSNG